MAFTKETFAEDILGGQFDAADRQRGLLEDLNRLGTNYGSFEDVNANFGSIKALAEYIQAGGQFETGSSAYTTNTGLVRQVQLPVSPAPAPTPTPEPTPEPTPTSDLFKVPTGSTGPGGEPIFDVFAGTEHISDPNDPRLTGVNIPDLPSGTAPAGFESEFLPVTPTPTPEPTPEPTPTPTPTNLMKVPTGSTGANGEPIFDVFDGTEHIDDPNDPRLAGVDIPNLPTGQAPEGFVSQFASVTPTPTPTEIPPGTQEGDFVPGLGTLLPDGTFSGDPSAPPTEPTPTPDTTIPTSVTGIPELDALLERMNQMLEDSLAAGNTINPNIELEPGIINQFLAQAESEFEPFFSGQIRSIKEDLSSNLEFLGEQYRIGKEEEEARFKRTLGAARETRAGRGTIFTGARGREEEEFAESTGRALELSALETERAARGGVTVAERQIGTRNLPGITTPLTTFGAEVGGEGRFTSGRTLSFGGIGDVTGSLEREQTTAVQQRRNELEAAERQRRSLNFLST